MQPLTDAEATIKQKESMLDTKQLELQLAQALIRMAK